MNIPILENPFIKALMYVLIVVAITVLATKIVTLITHRMEKRYNDMTATYLIRDIIISIIYFIAVMAIMQLFGINLAGTLLSLGIVGIAVSFAAKDIIANLFSGIMLILGRSVKVGDTLKINEEKGYVEKVSLRSTTIVDDYGVRNHVPNSVLTNNEYLEFTEYEVNRVDIMVGLPLNVDVVDFRKHILAKINSYPEISDKPKPEIYGREISFKQSKFKVSFWVNNFNDKDKYKIIITNDIRKYIQGETDE